MKIYILFTHRSFVGLNAGVPKFPLIAAKLSCED
jgi:hypothetical protein